MKISEVDPKKHIYDVMFRHLTEAGVDSFAAGIFCTAMKDKATKRLYARLKHLTVREGPKAVHDAFEDLGTWALSSFRAFQEGKESEEEGEESEHKKTVAEEASQIAGEIKLVGHKPIPRGEEEAKLKPES